MNSRLFSSETNGLYSELDHIHFDAEGTELTFVQRLTSENGWRIKYTERVLVEYRRFLILVKLTEASLSPSDAVDQAWHLHLLYSQSYWDELCAQFLQKPLHHQPMSKAGKDKELFYAQYGRTLVRYREVFGENPPEDIWPRERKKIANARYQRIDMNDYNSKISCCKFFALASAVLLFFLNAFGASMFFAFFSMLLYSMFITIVFDINGIATGEAQSDSNGRGGDDGGCGGGCGGGGCGGG